MVNFATEPIKTSEIIESFFEVVEFGSEKGGFGTYNMLSQHAELFGGKNGHMYDKEYVLSRMGEFVENYKK